MEHFSIRGVKGFSGGNLHTHLQKGSTSAILPPFLVMLVLCILIYAYIERGRMCGVSTFQEFRPKVSSQRILNQIIAQEGHPHHLLINSISRVITQGTLMQIGANVGAVGNDPLYKILQEPHMNSWKKYFIEPIPPLYERLVENYRDIVNSSFINVGIRSMGQARTSHGMAHQPTIMYCYDWERLAGQVPSWFSQICSMQKDRLNHPYDVKRIDTLPGNLTDYIVEYTIRERTVQSLLQESHVNTIDLLIIDTEGMDDIIVSDIMTETEIMPCLIVYEDVLLSQERKRKIETLLKNKGYSVFPSKGQDTIALHSRDVYT